MESKLEAGADAQFLDAMNYALYSLVRFDGLVALVEGKQVRMDFAYEIDRLKRAMERLGVDFSRPLIAPIKPGGPMSDRRK
ncbi:UNVERIFIED_ORG: hypothetical protein ABIC62_005711 [Burkholderia sp. 1595]|uniref:Nucleotide modification associated domain-containing protein n=1 Tax=Paraburkholderia terricola TaxID=169427 RepID=A0ABU1LZM5_9BURK|nr:hypothetical protein [Paraburkholderia terricola]MDR6412213.1 hypothetical protein [Paraburkholderia terricola]